jgi:dihydrodipicolinate synthase/N-acetylneuraminate lyase
MSRAEGRGQRAENRGTGEPSAFCLLPSAFNVVAALVTPYNGYGGIDTDGVGRLVERAIAGGVGGILVNGEIGEAAHLSRGERLFVIEAALEAAAGRVPLWAGTGAVGGEETLALTWDAGKAGVAAAVVAAPFYYRLPQSALVAHYREIAQRGKLPIIVNNAPTPLGNNLEPATLAELAGIAGTIGIIQSNHDLGELAVTVKLAGDHCPVLGGWDGTAYPALQTGVQGIVSALAGIWPQEIVGLWAAFAAGDQAAAQATWQYVQRFGPFLEDQGKAVAACKAALTLLGLPGGEPRRPLPGLSDEERDKLRQMIGNTPIVS